MRIKLFPNAAENYVRRCYRHAHPQCGMLHNPIWAKMLSAVEGQWLEVETNWLFKDQFNTAPIPGVSELGMRIMAEDVEEIEGDVRPGMIRDNYTHKSYATIDEVPSECFRESRFPYLVKWEQYKEGRGVHMKEIPYSP